MTKAYVRGTYLQQIRNRGRTRIPLHDLRSHIRGGNPTKLARSITADKIALLHPGYIHSFSWRQRTPYLYLYYLTSISGARTPSPLGKLGWVLPAARGTAGKGPRRRGAVQPQPLVRGHDRRRVGRPAETPSM